MNTVDALNVLGKALCGDSFETKPGLTDAETILEIAKNYEGGSGSGGGSNEFIIPCTATIPDGGGQQVMETTMPFYMIRTALEAGKDLVLDFGEIGKQKLTYAAGMKSTLEAAHIDTIRGITSIMILPNGTLASITSIAIKAAQDDISAPRITISSGTFSVGSHTNA